MLKEQIDFIKSAAEKNFLNSGSLMPVFISDFNNQFSIMPLFWANPEDKEEFAHHLRHWIANGKITEYIMVAESWVVKSTGTDKDPSIVSEVSEWMKKNGSLENHPLRTEAIVIQYCSAREEVDYHAEIHRSEDGVKLLDWNKNTRKGMNASPFNMPSRFSNIFARSSAALN